MPLDLFQLAVNNSYRLTQALDDVLQDISDEARNKLESFVDHVATCGRSSINMRPSVLRSLLQEGSYLNIWQWTEKQARVSRRPVEQILGEKLGRFWPLRRAFDEAFEGGREFIYAALNIGGPGCTEWGDFCVVLANSVCDAASGAAYLRHDSADTYVGEDGTLLLERLRVECASHSHRGSLAALKHQKAVLQTRPEEWPRIVLNSEDYIEVILQGCKPAEHVEEVRLTPERHRELWKLAFDDFGRTLGDAETALVQDFAEILEAATSGRIAIVTTQSE